jgi:hypothetical protein
MVLTRKDGCRCTVAAEQCSDEVAPGNGVRTLAPPWDEVGVPAIENPRTRNRSFDVWVRPDTAAAGDTVTTFATVHNFSLADRLSPVAPNPFRDRTTISFDLPSAGRASLMVFDLSGRRVATLANGLLPAGTHTRRWDGRSDSGTLSPAGVYFCRLRSDAFVETRRMLLMR